MAKYIDFIIALELRQYEIITRAKPVEIKALVGAIFDFAANSELTSGGRINDLFFFTKKVKNNEFNSFFVLVSSLEKVIKTNYDILQGYSIVIDKYEQNNDNGKQKLYNLTQILTDEDTVALTDTALQFYPHQERYRRFGQLNIIRSANTSLVIHSKHRENEMGSLRFFRQWNELASRLKPGKAHVITVQGRSTKEILYFFEYVFFLQTRMPLIVTPQILFPDTGNEQRSSTQPFLQTWENLTEEQKIQMFSTEDISKLNRASCLKLDDHFAVFYKKMLLKNFKYIKSLNGVRFLLIYQLAEIDEAGRKLLGEVVDLALTNGFSPLFIGNSRFVEQNLLRRPKIIKMIWDDPMHDSGKISHFRPEDRPLWEYNSPWLTKISRIALRDNTRNSFNLPSDRSQDMLDKKQQRFLLLLILCDRILTYNQKIEIALKVGFEFPFINKTLHLLSAAAFFIDSNLLLINWEVINKEWLNYDEDEKILKKEIIEILKTGFRSRSAISCYFEQALDYLYLELEDKNEWLRVCFSVISFLIEHENYRQALKLLKSMYGKSAAIAGFSRFKDGFNTRISRLLGRDFSIVAEYGYSIPLNEFKKNYYQGLTEESDSYILKKNSNDNYQLFYNFEISRLTISQASISIAANTMKKYLSAFDQSADSELALTARLELAFYFFQKGEEHNSDEFFSLAAQLAWKGGFDYYYIIAQINRATLFYFTGNLSEVFKKLTLAEEVLAKNNFINLQLICLMLRGRALAFLGYYKKARLIFLSGAQLAKKTNSGKKALFLAWTARCFLYENNESMFYEVWQHLADGIDKELLICEKAVLSEDYETAFEISTGLIQSAHSLSIPTLKSCDFFLWTHSFSLLEERSAFFSTKSPFIVHYISAINAFSESMLNLNSDGQKKIDKLIVLYGDDVHTCYNYLFLYFNSVISRTLKETNDKNDNLTYLSKAIKNLQKFATKIKDHRHRYDFIHKNYWNKLLYDQAKKHNLT